MYSTVIWTVLWPSNQLEHMREARLAGNLVKFEMLLSFIRAAIDHFPDRRTGSNTNYSMHDIAMAAFSVFYTQNPSFLAHQKAMRESKGKDNAQTLFGIQEIPCDNHIRDILDPVAPSYLSPGVVKITADVRN